MFRALAPWIECHRETLLLRRFTERYRNLQSIARSRQPASFPLPPSSSSVAIEPRVYIYIYTSLRNLRCKVSLVLETERIDCYCYSISLRVQKKHVLLIPDLIDFCRKRIRMHLVHCRNWTDTCPLTNSRTLSGGRN